MGRGPSSRPSSSSPAPIRILAGDTYARDLPGGPTELVTQGDPSCAPCGSSDSANAGFAGSSSDGSKVFFETSESLVPADADEANDVYRRSAGATTLVSDGNQEQPANLSAASADGSKVFFVTAEPLLVADKNAATDVYLWHGGARELVTVGRMLRLDLRGIDGGRDRGRIHDGRAAERRRHGLERRTSTSRKSAEGRRTWSPMAPPRALPRAETAKQPRSSTGSPPMAPGSSSRPKNNWPPRTPTPTPTYMSTTSTPR